MRPDASPHATAAARVGSSADDLFALWVSCASRFTAEPVSNRPRSGTRAVRVLGVLVSAVLLWLSVMLGWVDAQRYLSPAMLSVVSTLPLWLIVAFGAYSLASIGWALLTFRDCPAAFVELEGDIKRSRERLAKKGFKFDE